MEPVAESYVNLIPTPQGGTHVNGLRTGLTEAIREFCEFRNLLPRGMKLAPEDVWNGCAYVLSVKLQAPQFAGKHKVRVSWSERQEGRRVGTECRSTGQFWWSRE